MQMPETGSKRKLATACRRNCYSQLNCSRLEENKWMIYV